MINMQFSNEEANQRSPNGEGIQLQFFLGLQFSSRTLAGVTRGYSCVLPQNRKQCLSCESLIA